MGAQAYKYFSKPDRTKLERYIQELNKKIKEQVKEDEHRIN